MIISPLISMRGFLLYITKKNIYLFCVLYMLSIYLCFIKLKHNERN